MRSRNERLRKKRADRIKEILFIFLFIIFGFLYVSFMIEQDNKQLESQLSSESVVRAKELWKEMESQREIVEEKQRIRTEEVTIGNESRLECKELTESEAKPVLFSDELYGNNALAGMLRVSEVDDNGVYNSDGYYIVIVSEYSGFSVGDSLVVSLSTGEVLKCIVGDVTGDKELIFICDRDKVSYLVDFNQDLSYLVDFAGTITDISIE